MLCHNFVRRICSRKVCDTTHQQVATYLIPPFPERLKNRLDNHQSAKITKLETERHCMLYGKHRKTHIELLKRKKYARFGSLSCLNPATLFPSKKYIAGEREAEKRWWPTLQQMIKEVTEKNEKEKLEKQQREKKIAENMAKMPEWIAKFEAEQKEAAEKAEQDEEKKRMELEQVQEKFGYAIPRNNRLLIQYITDSKERARKEKKKLKKLQRA